MKKSLAVLGVLALAACSKGGASTSTAATQPTGAAGQQSTQQRFPGANGEIAAIDGQTLQVQSSTDQTAVTWSATTTFTDTVATTASAVSVGSCVVVRDANQTANASSTPDPSATRPTAVTATSVAVSAPVNGSCTNGRLGGGGGGFTPPSGFARPSGAPNGFTPPSGAPGGGGLRGFGGGGAFGKVTSLSSGGFVVTSELPAQGGGTGTTSTTTVTTTATTTYTTEKKATSAALKVGECVQARGQSDSSGTVAATSIAIRPKTNGTCNTGFGGPRG